MAKCSTFVSFTLHLIKTFFYIIPSFSFIDIKLLIVESKFKRIRHFTLILESHLNVAKLSFLAGLRPIISYAASGLKSNK